MKAPVRVPISSNTSFRFCPELLVLTDAVSLAKPKNLAVSTGQQLRGKAIATYSCLKVPKAAGSCTTPKSSRSISPKRHRDHDDSFLPLGFAPFLHFALAGVSRSILLEWPCAAPLGEAPLPLGAPRLTFGVPRTATTFRDGLGVFESTGGFLGGSSCGVALRDGGSTWGGETRALLGAVRPYPGSCHSLGSQCMFRYKRVNFEYNSHLGHRIPHSCDGY